MAQKIYKLFLSRSPKEAWYQLTKEEQAQLIAKVDAARDSVGGKLLVMCDARWSAEQWSFFGVEEFPDIEAVRKHSALLTELNWFRYIDDIAVIGTEWQS